MTDQKPIVVYGVNSPNVVKIAIMLEELALPYELRFVSVFKGEQFTPEFLALNPLGKVPVLVDSELDQPLAESGAILIWLAEKSGKLLPIQPSDRYEVLQWLMIQMSTIGPMLGQFTHYRLLPEGSEPYSLGRYEAIAKRLYTLVDDRLKDRQWIAGGSYSIADIAIFPWAEYLERHGLSSENYPAMRQWRENIANRPAVIRAKERANAAFTQFSQESMGTATTEDLDRFFGRTDDMPSQDYTAVTRLK